MVPQSVGRLVASFLETSPLYPPLLEGEGVRGEVQAERIQREYGLVWYYSERGGRITTCIRILGTLDANGNPGV